MHPQAVDKTQQQQQERTAATPLPVNKLSPPTYGQAQREAISSVVDSMANDICQRINMLRKQLDEIENIILQGSAHAKHMLSEQVLLCTRLSDEVSHSQEVIADLKDAAKAAQGE
jgi:pantothenate kinase